MLKYYGKTIALLILFMMGAGATNAQSHARWGDKVIYLSANPYLVEGEDAFFEGKYEKSIKLLTKAMGPKLRGKSLASVYNAICASENALGQYEKALEHCSLAIKTSEKYWMAYVNRGHTQKSLGNAELAYADYCAAREIAPSKVSGSFTKHCVSKDSTPE